MEKYKGVMKVKRKELEEVNDDFSDFSLSSPARKIRRLDIELPPIVEEEEIDHSMGYDQVIPDNPVSGDVGNSLKMSDIEELPPAAGSEEKAIVLFKPVNSSLCHSMCNFSVDPNLISSFKNQPLWGMNVGSGRNEDKDLTDGNNGEVNACRAVIPWSPSQKLNLEPEQLDSQSEVPDSMDAEEPDVMDFEDAGAGISDVSHQPSEFYHLSRVNQGLPHQWQQQHCMFPQPPQNVSTPVVWYR